MNARRLLAAVAAFAVAMSGAVSAMAEPVNEMIPRLIEEGGWLRAHYPGQVQDKGGSPFFGNEPATTVPESLLGGRLHIAVLARDWSAAYSLTDRRALLFDRVRMIRSNRMGVTRVSMSGGTFLPYAELSFGQWRADTDLVPWLKNEIEVAGQIAAGFEMHLASRCVFAWDVEQTQIYTDQQNVPATRMFASFAALRAEF